MRNTKKGIQIFKTWKNIRAKKAPNVVPKNAQNKGTNAKMAYLNIELKKEKDSGSISAKVEQLTKENERLRNDTLMANLKMQEHLGSVRLRV